MLTSPIHSPLRVRGTVRPRMVALWRASLAFTRDLGIRGRAGMARHYLVCLSYKTLQRLRGPVAVIRRRPLHDMSSTTGFCACTSRCSRMNTTCSPLKQAHNRCEKHGWTYDYRSLACVTGPQKWPICSTWEVWLFISQIEIEGSLWAVDITAIPNVPRM